MYRYENIKKVLAFVPSGLLEEENEASIIKNAYQGYLINVKNVHTKGDILSCIMQLDEHVATLPTNFKRFIEVVYAKSLYNTTNTFNDSNTWFLQEDINGIHTTIFQRIVYQYFRPYSNYMRYVGSNPGLFDNDCINLLCDCDINFTVSKDATTITTDMQDGYVIMMYEAVPKDEKGNILVPDDNVLWQALAMYAEAKHWQDRAFRKEENAQAMFVDRMAMANNYFKTFEKQDLFRKFDSETYEAALILPRLAPMINAQIDTNNSHR